MSPDKVEEADEIASLEENLENKFAWTVLFSRMICDKYNLECDVDWVVVLSDDLEGEVGPKRDSIGNCPDGE